MDFALSDEQQQILATVRKFVERELMPLEAKVQSENVAGRVFPDKQTWLDLRAKAKEQGLWGLQVPAELGGADLDAVTTMMITMEQNRALVPFTFGGFVPEALFTASQYIQDKYLKPLLYENKMFAAGISEPDAGSDATAIKTTAVKKGDKWVINGTKTWISRGSELDVCLVLAVTDKEKGARGGMTVFVVDRSMGFSVEPITMMAPSMKGEPTPATLNFVDMEVPEENILGEIGGGLRLLMETIGVARLLAASAALGAAQRLLDMAIEYAKIRKSFGQSLSEYQAIQWMIADSAIELQSAKWLTLHAAWRHDNDKDTRYEQSLAKYAGTNAAWQVADRVLQIHGALGYTKDLPIERVMRHLRVFRIFEGSDEIMKRNAARMLIDGRASVSNWD
jgi:Acyl-CoA dehydrogenases